MSFEIARAVWNYTGDDLNGTQTAILVRMAWYASEAGRDIFPTVAKLCAQTKFKERTVRKVLKYLKDKQFLIIETASKGRHSVTYKINVERLNLQQEFTDKSNAILDIEPCTPCTVEDEPCTKRRVNPARGAANPAPGAPIYTSNNNINNNTVVDEIFKTIKQATSKEQIHKWISSQGSNYVSQKVAIVMNMKDVRNIGATLRRAIEEDWPEPEINTTPYPIRNEDDTCAILEAQLPKNFDREKAKKNCVKVTQEAKALLKQQQERIKNERKAWLQGVHTASGNN